jgi:diguanylate cyclase (GGDEF)-like protein
VDVVCREPRLLVVDDDPLICRSLARALAPRGFDVAVAGSAIEALTLFTQVTYPVVITDLRMPGVDGLALIEELHQIDPNTTFVLITSQTVLRRARGQSDLSIVAVVNKPWDDAELFAAIEQARDLNGRRTRALDEVIEGEILLLEENDVEAERMEDLLGQGPFRVRWVTRLKEALEILRCGEYPVVLTNLSLPDARGLDCVSQIARAAPFSATLVLSGTEDESFAAQALRTGAEDFLFKPQLTGPTLRRAIRFALERKGAERRVAELAHTDALTGVANRSAFTDRVRRALAHARRAKRGLSLLYLDLDRFKDINDRRGHATGDLVLQTFAQALIGAVRPYDTVGRMGGDEFAVLLEEIDDPLDVLHVAERIIAAIRVPIQTPNGPLQIGTSIGIASFPDQGDRPDQLFAEADAAMYRAKRSGTNRICQALEACGEG